MDQQKTRDILKKVRQIEIRTRQLVTDSLAGSYHSVFKGSGMNFDEVRPYVDGDEIRTIDWNVTARTGTAHVKKFVEERELTIMLMIDVSASTDFGSAALSKRELMAELGSVLAFSAVRNHDKVGLILFSDFIELYIAPGKGRTHILRVIREILYYRPRGKKTDPLCALDFISKVQKRKTVAFLISDYCLGDDFTQELAALKKKMLICNRHHDLISVIVTDPREEVLPECGRLLIEDAETGEQILLNSADGSVRQRYNRLSTERRTRLRHSLGSAGIDSLDLTTDRSYIGSLLTFFGTRRRRLAR